MFGQFTKPEHFFKSPRCRIGAPWRIFTYLPENIWGTTWCVTEGCFAEGLQRLFCKSQGLTLPDDLRSLLNEAKTEEDFEHLTSQEASKVFEKLYEEKRNQCLQGNFGKTAQFWMMYLQLTERQHKLHLSIN